VPICRILVLDSTLLMTSESCGTIRWTETRPHMPFRRVDNQLGQQRDVNPTENMGDVKILIGTIPFDFRLVALLHLCYRPSSSSTLSCLLMLYHTSPSCL